MVTQLPRFDQMRYCKEGAENNADTSDDDVSDSKEGILASHDGASADYDGLRSAVIDDVEIWERSKSAAIPPGGERKVRG